MCIAISLHSFFCKNGFDLGINSGIQTTTLINKADQAAGPELNFKQKIGIPVGVSATYSLSHRVGIGIDIIYAHQGQTYVGQLLPSSDPQIYYYQVKRLAAMNGVMLTGNYTASVALNCIKVPFLFRYTGNTEKSVYFSSFIGPQITRLTSVNLKVNDMEVAPTGINASAGGIYKKTLIDGVLGLGTGFKLTSSLFMTAYLRLEYGLNDIERKDAAISYQGAEQKYWPDGRGANHSASAGLMIGVQYKFAKKERYAYKAKPHSAPVRKVK